MFSPKKIFVPVSLEPEEHLAMATKAVETAAEIGAKFGASVVLMFAAPPGGSASTAGMDFSGETYKAMQVLIDARKDAAAKNLEQLAEKARAAGVDVHTLISTAPEGVAELIVDESKKAEADLIVMTSHGRTGMKRLFLGSIAERVAHMAAAPTLILRAD